MSQWARTCGRTKTWVAKVTLLGIVVTLFVSAQPAALQAGPPASPASARVRFYGYIQEMSSGLWQIAGVQLVVDQDTIIDQSAGPAAVYAWVEVFAIHQDHQTLHADTITVLRAANTDGPIQQYTGTLYKQSPEAWSVSGTLFLITSETYIAGAMPGLGSLLKIVAQDRSGVLYALEIYTIAGSPAGVPVEFEGQISSEDPADHTWLVEGLTVHYDTQTHFQNGQPAVGQIIEVRAQLDASGEAMASEVHIKTGVLAPPASAPGPGAPTASRNSQVRPLQASAPSAGGPSYAEGGTPGWSAPVPVTDHQPYAAYPSVAYTADGTAHVVWEYNGTLLHAFRPPGANWSSPARVASGVTPSLVARPDGTLHLMFSHEFMGNVEIYYVTWANGHWTLPVNVSHTSGVSVSPSLAVRPDGSLLVAWGDDSQGEPLIYYGALDLGFWSSQPVPSTRGSSPQLVANASGRLYLAWQDMPASGSASDTDIYLMYREANQWGLPVNISDTPGSPSQGLSLTAGTDGLAHLAWVENDHAIYYAYAGDSIWSWPQPVVSSPALLQEPHLLADPTNTLVLTWVTDQTIQATTAPARSGLWRVPSDLPTQPFAGPHNLALANAPSGDVSLTWVAEGSNGSGDLAIMQSNRASVLSVHCWLPLLFQP